jgi:hypothetical protein
MRERSGFEGEIANLGLATSPVRREVSPDSAGREHDASQSREYVPVEELQTKYPLSNQSLFKFRSLVYMAQVKRALAKGKQFVDNIQKLKGVEKVDIHPSAAKPLQELLNAARLEISRQGKQITVKAGNAYRSADWQLETWATKRFPQYYEQATETTDKKTGKKKLPLIAPDDFSESAAKKLAAYIGARFAAPGFSNHQQGLAVDFHTTELFGLKPKKLKASFAHRKLWWKSWFWTWLEREGNAYKFGFVPYKKEPWHWEYRPEKAQQGGGSDSKIKTAHPKTTPTLAQPSSFAASPSLIKREEDVAAYTLYVDIKVGNESPAKPMTGIFIPQDYTPQQEIDLLIYLHGHRKKSLGKGNWRWYKDISIDEYWTPKHFPYFPLREELNKSGKSFILVVPTLHYKSYPGSLASVGGFDKYVKQVIAALSIYGPYKGTKEMPKVGRIVLAAHSAGGGPMLKLAHQAGAMSAKVQECWGFDCLYSGRNKETGMKYYTQPDSWLKWVETDRKRKLFVYYQSSTAKESLYLKSKATDKKLPNVSVDQSNADDHFWVPMKHWSHRIQKAFAS